MGTPTAERFAQVLTGEPGDLADFYQQARNDDPMFWSDQFNGWVASRYDDVKRVLTDEEHFGPLLSGGGSSIIHGRTILQMEGDEHRKKSAILGKHIRSPRLLGGVQKDFVVSLCDELARELPHGEPFDLKARYTTPMPLQVIAWLMDIAGAPDFRDTYDAIVAAGASNLNADPAIQKRGEAARTRLYDYVTPLIEERRADPGDDLLSVLCSTEYEGERLSDDECRAFCSFLLAAGVETTDRALSSLMKHLVSEPDLWQALHDDRALILPACAEALRWAPPVHALSRGTRAATDLAGQGLDEGDRVVVLMGAANRDESMFDDGDRFDLTRFDDDAAAQFTVKGRTLPFGAGRHFCTGSLLARLEMEEGLDRLLEEFDTLDWVDGVPDDRGYVLRSPDHLRIVAR